MSVFPQTISMLKLNPQCDGLGGGVLWKVTGW